jgi:hypothetical protein
MCINGVGKRRDLVLPGVNFLDMGLKSRVGHLKMLEIFTKVLDFASWISAGERL